MELDPAAAVTPTMTAIQNLMPCRVIRTPLDRPGWNRPPLIVPESADNAAVSTACRATMEEQDPTISGRAGMQFEGKIMKSLITVAVVVAIALVAFNYFQSGEFKLMPGSAMSDEAREVNRLRGDFREAAQQYRQAGRAAGLSGLDSTPDAENALTTIDGVERDLKKMGKKVEDPKVRQEIEKLLEEIADYKRKVQ
jgi:hypothetical protein